MAYKKPTYPLEIGDDYVYPITTYDQIINADGTRPEDIAETKDVPFLYAATFTIDAWSGSGPYTQAQTVTPLDGGGSITSSSIFASPAMAEKTTNQNTNETLQEVLGLFNSGYSNITATNQITATLFEKPTADIEAIWLIRNGDALQSFERTTFE